mmetsp:Transcript_27556/g.88588  ORF Transcript_27556/g.88588 Transcript_27556/m.88588 type:complete len:289 (+) Transcript_27556:493-1359(+)
MDHLACAMKAVTAAVLSPDCSFSTARMSISSRMPMVFASVPAPRVQLVAMAPSWCPRSLKACSSKRRFTLGARPVHGPSHRRHCCTHFITTCRPATPSGAFISSAPPPLRFPPLGSARGTSTTGSPRECRACCSSPAACPTWPPPCPAVAPTKWRCSSPPPATRQPPRPGGCYRRCWDHGWRAWRGDVGGSRRCARCRCGSGSWCAARTSQQSLGRTGSLSSCPPLARCERLQQTSGAPSDTPAHRTAGSCPRLHRHRLRCGWRAAVRTRTERARSGGGPQSAVCRRR